MPFIGPAVFRHTDPSKTGFRAARPWSSQDVGISGYQVNARQENQVLWSYEVPADTKLAVNSLTIKANVPGLALSQTLFSYVRSAGMSRMGILELHFNGSAVLVAECRANGDWEGIVANGYPSLITMSVDPLVWGDGIEVGAGDEIEAFFTPYDPGGFNGNVYGMAIRGHIHAKVTATGEPFFLEFNTLGPTDFSTYTMRINGADLYSPPSGAEAITMLGMSITADVQSDWVAAAFVNLRLNGEVIAELGNLTGHPKQDLLYTLPLWGAELYPGDLLELQGSPWCAAGQAISVALNGVTTSIGAVAVTEPSFTNVSPTSGTVLTSTTTGVTFQVSNPDELPFAIWVKFRAESRAFLVYDSLDGFKYPFTASTVDASDPTLPAFVLNQVGGWQDEIEDLRLGGVA